jgi:3-oxoacyl-[acyl-carrier protein] reductase
MSAVSRSGPLLNKVALVTGASRGIGRAIAQRLARDGAAVTVNYANNQAAANDTVATIEAGGGRAVAIQADVGRVADVRRLFVESVARFGRIDILVNNAATFAYRSFAETTEEDFDRVFALNTRGPFFAMQEAARRLPDRGRVVNISSGVTTVGFPNQSVYCASKAALEQLTLVLANELGHRNITVNSVLVGATRTDMLSEVAVQAPGFDEAIIRRTPLGRLGEPDDIADVVAFLCSDDARWITGQSLRADGGAR